MEKPSRYEASVEERLADYRRTVAAGHRNALHLLACLRLAHEQGREPDPRATGELIRLLTAAAVRGKELLR